METHLVRRSRKERIKADCLNVILCLCCLGVVVFEHQTQVLIQTNCERENKAVSVNHRLVVRGHEV